MGRKPNPTLRYHMRSKEAGEIKAYLTYKGRRYFGGRTEIYTTSKIFADFYTSGELKACESITAEQSEICELLEIISKVVIANIKSQINNGYNVTPELFQSAMEQGRAAAMQQKIIWAANKEWNKRVFKAAQEGEAALDKFYKDNPPFSTLFPKQDENEEGE